MNALTMSITLMVSGCALALSGCDSRDDSTVVDVAQTGSDQDTARRDPGNTGNNRDDAARDARTSIDQSESGAHIALTADIREAVVADDTLSMSAKNCRIITDESGTVWLRGVVDSQTERNRIEQIARQFAGDATVVNELEIDDA